MNEENETGVCGQRHGRALHERLLFALEGEPDPWAERAAGASRTEFASFEPVAETA
jgi:nitrite reductase (NADH) large subunit